MKIKIKKTKSKALIPFYATDGAGAMDLTATLTETIDSEHVKYYFGIAFEIPKGYVGLIFPRSSCYKQGQIMSNCVGVIDSDYRGEVSAVMNGNTQTKYKNGDRVAQILFLQLPKVELVEVDVLTPTRRGEGGYGSTGN